MALGGKARLVNRKRCGSTATAKNPKETENALPHH